MRITDVAKVGDYVLYVPNRACFSVTADESGSKFTQYFYPSSLGGWRVFQNDGEHVEIALNCTLPDLVLNGARGYANCISILNNLANSCVNPNFAESGRSLGSKGTKAEMITYSCLADADVEYVVKKINELQHFDAVKDCCIEEDLKILSENALLHVGNFGVWLASRGIQITPRGKGFGVYVMYSEEVKDVVPLYCSVLDNKNYETFMHSKIYPIVKLKKDVLVKSGDGTSNKPYVLEV